MAEKDMGVFASFQSAMDEIKKNHHKINTYTTAWWGDKETDSGNMSNRGFVIGFRDPDSRAQWRLDYDPLKKLHINWTQDHQGGATKECYGISSIRPLDTLWEYYLAWTKPRVEEIPQEVKERLDKVGGSKSWNGRGWV